MRVIGQAGFSAAESMEAMQGVSDLATGTLSSMETTVDLVTTALRVFKIDAADTTGVVDVFANVTEENKRNLLILDQSCFYPTSGGQANDIGTVAMARTNDPHSATAQFFINVGQNNFLNFRSESVDGWGYCVFAEVTDGMDVVNKIKDVKTGNAGYHQDVPVEDVVIQKAEIVD